MPNTIQNNHQSSISKNLAKYIVIDTEATGLSLNHGVIQLAWIIVDINLEIMDQSCFDICPPNGYETSVEASKIHGISDQRIKNGKSYEEAAEQFYKNISKYFPKEKPVVIAQFWPFDYKMLEMMFCKVGQFDKFNSIIGNEFIDTKALVITLNTAAKLKNQPIPFPVTSLSKPGGLKEKFSLSFDSHDALGDCKGTLELFKKLLEGYF
jgi:DNA polymerase III epsilon subunit-like protein